MDLLRQLNFTLALMGSILWVIWVWRHQCRWGYAVAPLSYLVHVLAFYIFRAWLDLNPNQLNLWSSIIRTHELVLILGIAWLGIFDKFCPELDINA